MPISAACRLAACVALLAAVPAAAQDQSEAAPEARDIVVTGRAEAPPTDSEVTHQARTITQGTDLRGTALARFEDRLCPGVIGMKPEFASLMIDRIRAQAKQLDLWLTADDGTCRPNFIVAFVEDGKAALADLEKRQPGAFAPLATNERRDLLAEDGPVHVWTTTETRTRDGMAVVGERNNLTAPPVANMWSAHSKIFLRTREDITSVVVLFDMADVKGKTLLQLADYATMRGLARTRPVEGAGEEGVRAMDTILALFDPGAAPPAEMTAFDRAYLAALYDGIPNMPGISKVMGVNRQLRLQDAADAGESAE